MNATFRDEPVRVQVRVGDRTHTYQFSRSELDKFRVELERVLGASVLRSLKIV